MSRKRYEYRGKRYTAGELSKLSGIPFYVLYERLRVGWDVTRAVETKVALSVVPMASRTRPPEPPEYYALVYELVTRAGYSYTAAEERATAELAARSAVR